jgi:hypothetical protein
MQSSEIHLTAFRRILLLPLTLTGAEEDVAAATRRIADEVQRSGNWIELEDHLAHLGEVRERFAYGEFVYLHAYIQDFL